MSGRRVHQAIIKFWLSASLLAVLTACTTVAGPDSPRSSSPAARKPLKPDAPDLAIEGAPLPEASVDDKYRLTGEAARELERGQASWYGARFHGQRTASGERYDMYALTAAHKTLPFGTVVRVRSLLEPEREVEVRINDRGPFAPGRVIDLSHAAAEALGLQALGVTAVSLSVHASTPPQLERSERVQKVRRVKRRSSPGKRR